VNLACEVAQPDDIGGRISSHENAPDVSQRRVGGSLRCLNPANNELLAVVADGDEKDAQTAIGHARRAFDEGPWPRMRAPERAGYLFKLADLIDKSADALAELETRNNGKPLREAKFDVADAAACFAITGD
jgi:betaine-aldehyde dehydrogenase